MKELKTSYIAKEINGTLIGYDKVIGGIFNFLNAARKGDAVIRHWIDEKGVEIAARKGISCVITQNPKGNAIKTAEKLELPIIITEKIELANAFAINWAINKFANDSIRVVITGTNGKSTTAHMIYHILKEAGYCTYTNTDSKSEFNTLIDPMVAKQIAEFGEKIDAMVIEVSEVQGWLDNIMKDHAYLMTSAIDPDVVVITNVALDHIGLVNSIEETFDETSGAVKAINKENSHLILNNDDPLVKKMENLTPAKNIIFFGNNAQISNNENGIVYNGNIIIKKNDLPFKGNHFIQNIMAAIGAVISLNIDHKTIEHAVKTYKPLKRRFTIINNNPYIIDDFAHNPDGIRATIENAALMSNGNFFVVSAIRGSRGEIINQVNAEAIADGLQNIHYKLIVTSSNDVVDNLNIVTEDEKKVFVDTLENRGIKYIFYKRLYDALEEVLNLADNKDTILLIGAQGMDPANELLEKILKSKKKLITN
ncbi:MAG: Mur ligase family protein [Methanobacterium sp.]|uniref:Mur ligase family protein n=1 Tax=Methanobacterium sp. TaxID=2164 RepID=UPI003D66098A|nr:Mur ligase family protein [Methanobacterium sp.]